jgi:hypothetical protein
MSDDVGEQGMARGPDRAKAARVDMNLKGDPFHGTEISFWDVTETQQGSRGSAEEPGPQDARFSPPP